MKKLPNAFPQASSSIFQPKIFQQVTTSVLTNVITEPTKPFKAKKAGTNGFLLFLLLDESGSMHNLTKDTIGGVNALITQQKADKDNTRLTVIKFEGNNIVTSLDNVNIHSIDNFTDYAPKGGTNLLDAVGFTMEKINSALAKFKKADRPSVFVQIITDGYENASRKFNRPTIKSMIESATKSDWVVTYVGANVDSFAESSSLGISSAATSNYSTNATASTYGAISSSLTRMKSARSLGMAAQQLYTSGLVFNDEEKTLMKGE